MIIKVFRAYNTALHRYPLVTQCATTGTLLAAGDIIAQKLIEKRTELNWKRTSQFGALGLLFVGPVIKNWFVLLERVFGATGKLTPLKKVVTDQVLMPPFLQFSCISILGLMNFHSMDKIKGTLKKDYFDVLIANYKFWPFVQLINFYYVPLNYRLPVVAVAALFWNTYFTWKLGEKH